MKSMTALVGAATWAIGIAAGSSLAQQPPQGPQPFFVGNRLGLPITPAPDGAFDADLVEREGVRRDLLRRELLRTIPVRGVIVVPNRGVPQNVQTNNAWVSFINHDGSVHTARWIGVQNPARAGQPDAAAGAQRAVRQRHQQRHAVRRRSRRRHDRRPSPAWP